jgi:hypothetical protein
MKTKKRNVAREIVADWKKMHAAMKSGEPLGDNFPVRTVRSVADPARVATTKTGSKSD